MPVGHSFTRVCVGLLSTIACVAHAEPTRGLFWSAADGPLTTPAQAGFTEAVRALGGEVAVLPIEPEPVPQLEPELEQARTEYRRFAFATSIAKLDDLVRRAEPTGGADLDSTQLSDLYFYRWLCHGELGRTEGSWDDLVQAARLAPARVLDTAQVPPKAVSAWHRAVAEVSALHRAKVTIDAPPDAHVQIDGAENASGELLLGRHFVRITAPGMEGWAGVVQVTSPNEHLAPPLRPRHAPDIESLAASGRTLLGALERAGPGWRFVVRAFDAKDGRLTSQSVQLTDDSGVRGEVAALVRRVTETPKLAIAAVPPSPPPSRRKLWLGLGIGAGVVVIGAIAISLGVVYGRSTATGTVSASLGGLK